MDWLEKFFKWEKKEAPEAEKSDQELDLFDEPVAKKGEEIKTQKTVYEIPVYDEPKVKHIPIEKKAEAPKETEKEISAEKETKPSFVPGPDKIEPLVAPVEEKPEEIKEEVSVKVEPSEKKEEAVSEERKEEKIVTPEVKKEEPVVVRKEPEKELPVKEDIKPFSKEEYPKQQSSTNQVLNKFLRTEGITGVLIASMDGFLLGSAGRVGMDLEAVGVLASSEVNCAQVLTDEMESGKLNQIILEYNSGRVVLELIGTDIILAVIGTTQSNLGMLRLAINNLKTEVIKSIEV